ncbi:MAG: DUF4239 domain-containing protein [Proteobacteria bacterium]|nr:DUF4239 domain-containing protein [Pseudomonadota bacterium]
MVLKILARAAPAAIATLTSTGLGILARIYLVPDIHAVSNVMTLTVALVASLFSIVLGLLISSSYNTFNNYQSDFQKSFSQLSHIEYIVRRMVPYSESAHKNVLEVAARVKARYWPNGRGVKRGEVSYNMVHADITALVAVLETIMALPQSDKSELGRVRDLAASFIELQYSIVRSLTNVMPLFLLLVIFGWACLLFLFYGLLGSDVHLTLTVAALASLAISSAYFLISELTDPFRGVFQVSSEALDMLIEDLQQQTDSQSD